MRVGRVGIVHVHSSYSHDGRDSLARLADIAKDRGIAFVGLTDHAEDLDAALFERYLTECAAVTAASGVTMIPGLEYRFLGLKGMHLLAFGLSRWMVPATPAEFLAQARDFARFTMAAHPGLYGYRLPEEVAARIDAIEIWNAGYNTRWLPDPKAIRLLGEVRRQRPEVVGVAGLDQHDASNDRETRVLLLTADRTADPLQELKAGRFTNLGRTMRLDPRTPVSRPALAVLRLARWGFDRLERAQDAAVRLIRRRRR